MRKLAAAVLCVSNLAFHAPAWAGGGVRNGGDILHTYLEDTRHWIKTALVRLHLDEAGKASLCQGQRLTAAQVEHCRSFILETSDQVLLLTTGSRSRKRTEFEIHAQDAERPFTVPGPGPQKNPIVVGARTLPSPEGNIEFNYDRIERLYPFEMMMLMMHEFGHKVEYRGRHILDDEPFPTQGQPPVFHTGRQFLDAVGRGLATYADRQGLIGKDFVFYDHFICRLPGNGRRATSLPGKSPRRLRDRLNFDVYDITIGRLPGDFSFHFDEESRDPAISSRIVPRIHIREASGCRKEPGKEGSTRVELWRVVTSAEPDSAEREELLDSVTFPFNPVCEKDPIPFGIALEALDVKFSCVYSRVPQKRPSIEETQF